MNISKKLIAEAIGTFVLVFFACGTAIVTGNTVATALSFGLVIVAMAYSIGRISGCHINPAVSFACALTKRMTWKEFLQYVVAQCIGGLCGGLLLFGILRMSGTQASILKFAGSNMAINGLNFGSICGSLLLEIVLTCVFIYTILNVTDDKNEGVGKKAGLIIGLTLTLVHLLGINLTGTSVNPARSIATALSNLCYTGDFTALSHVWIFILAPMAGALLAAVLYKYLNAEEDIKMDAE